MNEIIKSGTNVRSATIKATWQSASRREEKNERGRGGKLSHHLAPVYGGTMKRFYALAGVNFNANRHRHRHWTRKEATYKLTKCCASLYFLQRFLLLAR